MYKKLSDVISFWREQYPDRSWSWFAKKCGLNSTTLKRIHSGEINSPNFSTAWAVCLVALDSEVAKSVLIDLFPQKEEEILSHFNTFNKVERFNDAKVLQIFSDFYKWHIFHLCLTTGLDDDSIRHLGGIYQRKIAQLSEDGLIFKSNDKYCSAVGLNHVASKRYFLKSAENILKAVINRDEMGKIDSDGILNFYIHGINSSAKAEIREVLKSASTEINRITSDPRNAGPLASAALLMLSDID